MTSKEYIEHIKKIFPGPLRQDQIVWLIEQAEKLEGFKSASRVTIEEWENEKYEGENPIGYLIGTLEEMMMTMREQRR